MYIYDRKLSGPQSRPTEQLITSRPAQYSSYYFDRGISGFGKRGESRGSYVWTDDGLGEICVSPSVSANDPTALNLSPVGTSAFNVRMDVRETRYQVKGNIFYPGETSGASAPFNTSAVAKEKAPIVFIAHGQHATFRNPDPQKRADECGYNTADCNGYLPIASYKGYEYLQELLARMGIISVSVDCNEFSGNRGFFRNEYSRQGKSGPRRHQASPVPALEPRPHLWRAY